MPKLHLILTAAAVAAPLAAIAPARPLGASAPVPFTTIEKGFFSGWPQGAIDLVIRRPLAWQRTWQVHTSNQFPPPPAPAVDFDTETVIAVFMGTQFPSGHEIEIVSIQSDGTQVDVFVTNTVPGPDCITIPVFNHPYHFVRIPKTTLPVVFHHVPAVNTCS